MSFLYKPVEHILTFASKIILAAAFKPVEGVKVFQVFFIYLFLHTPHNTEQYKTFLQNQCVHLYRPSLFFFYYGLVTREIMEIDFVGDCCRPTDNRPSSF